MNYLAKVLDSSARTLLSGESFVLNQIRGKKVKTKGSTRNAPRHTRPKHRGWKVQDGCYVSANKILATQMNLRFHPGLNVCIYKNLESNSKQI